MRIAALPPLGADKTVYIVGTGPSLRCTPLSFLRDKVTIGLNQAWRHLPLTYGLTVHPELMLDQHKSPLPSEMKWIIKRKPPFGTVDLDDPRFFCFDTSYDLKTVAEKTADTLYLGEGAQTTAMDLASRMGAKFVVLVGCDACSLAGDFHGHNQHVRWLGMKPDHQYRAYRETTAEVRRVLRGLGVEVLTLSPFIGAKSADEDYGRLKKELKLKPLPKPADVSPYTRDPKSIRSKTPVEVKKVPKASKRPALRHAPKPPKRKLG